MRHKRGRRDHRFPRRGQTQAAAFRDALDRARWWHRLTNGGPQYVINDGRGNYTTESGFWRAWERPRAYIAYVVPDNDETVS